MRISVLHFNNNSVANGNLFNMEAFTQFFLDHGYWGMAVAAFIAGSVFPFSSEAVMLGLLAIGLDPLKIGIFGTVGNVLGSMFNYWVGTFGRVEWIEKYLHVKRKSLEKAQRFVGGHGAWIGFFCFLPILGSGIAIALGMLRSNVVLTTTSVFLGKAIRYAIVIGVYVMFKVVL